MLTIEYSIFVAYPHDNSSDHWVSVLIASNHWRIKDLRAHAIKRLEALKVEPVRRIQLYRDTHADKEVSLHPAYLELCERVDPITTPEGERLGLETVTKLFTIREKILRLQLSTKVPKEEALTEERKKLIVEAFGKAPAVLNGVNGAGHA